LILLFHPIILPPLQLANWINTTGYTFINYRGAGSVNYWAGSYGSGIGDLFTNDNIKNDLNNGYMLPMITSMTCGGGDFADEDYPSCFGELWLKIGSPSNPRGAIGFIGPSEHDTKTRFNNTNAMGIYQGITNQGITRCGEMLLRGKMALYNNYPDLLEMGEPCQNVPFYFYVYGLLGDPGLAIWTDTPKEIEMSYNDTISYLDNFLQVNIENSNDKSDFVIAITNEDSLITIGRTNNNGEANISINLLPAAYSVTASKYGFIPQTDTLTVIQNNTLGMNEYAFSDELIPANIITLGTTLQNYMSSELQNITFSLSTIDDYIEILSDSVTVSSLPSQHSVQLSFDFQIGNSWKYDYQTEIFLNAFSNEIEEQFMMPLTIKAPYLTFNNLSVISPDTCLLIGEENNARIDLKNIGNLDTEAFQAELVSRDNKTEIVDSVSDFDNIAVSESGYSVSEFTISVQHSLFSGEFVNFNLEILQG